MNNTKHQEQHLQKRIVELEEELSTLKKKQENILGENISFHDFMAVLTHKILTPMNSIIGLTNFLKDTPLSNEQQQLTERIRSNGISLVNIYNEILDFVQLDPNDLMIKDQEFNLEKSIYEVINLFYAHAFNNKNVEVVPLIPETVQIMLSGDQKRLEQVLLLSFGEPKQEALQKKVTLEVSGFDEHSKMLKIMVTHNPAVLTNQHIQLLSDSNSKTWLESVNNDNSFFKFMFAKRITELSGGTFTVQKGENITRLHVDFPVKELDDKTSASRKTIIPEFNGLQVLVATSNIAYQQQLKKTFGFWGIKTYIAQSEKDAILKTIREPHLNFVIVSDQLPDTSAKSLAKKIKSLPGKNEMPVLLLKTRQSIIPSSDLFTDEIYSTENTTTLFEKLLKNIALQKIKREPYKLDTKLAIKIPLNILVIEDDKTNLDLLFMLLKKLGYKAQTALSGKEGIEKVREQKFDIVFLDIQMPGMDGFKVARYIRDNILHSEDIKMIATSANTLRKTQQKALNAGMIDFVSKPISFRKIEETIIRWGFAEDLLKLNQ